MNSLRKLIMESIEEGETKRRNKEKKKAAGFTGGAARKEMEYDPDRLRSKGWHALSARKFIDAGHEDQGRDPFMVKYGVPKTHSLPKDAEGRAERRKNAEDPAWSTRYQWQGTDSDGYGKASPVPDSVRVMASRSQGGKVVFGRYYDGQGNYLGRTQGGEWIDGQNDPQAQTQMEMYNKLQELQNFLQENTNNGLVSMNKSTLRKLIMEGLKEGNKETKAKSRAAGFGGGAEDRAIKTGDDARDIKAGRPTTAFSPSDIGRDTDAEITAGRAAQRQQDYKGDMAGSTMRGKSPSTRRSAQTADMQASMRGKAGERSMAAGGLTGAGAMSGASIQQDPARRSAGQWQGTDSSGAAKASPVPPEVQQAASKEAGGKVVFGRYYDAQGTYLGRSQGGQWVDGASDPQAQTQMEMYNKLQELRNTLREAGIRNSSRNMVKEVMREMMRNY